MSKLKGHGERLLFDDDGKPRKVYDIRDAEKEFEGMDVMRVGKEFAEGEREKMKEKDVQDKFEAKEKKKEKKRKRKDREKEVSYTQVNSSESDC